jgi:hypothetical protein
MRSEWVPSVQGPTLQQLRTKDIAVVRGMLLLQLACVQQIYLLDLHAIGWQTWAELCWTSDGCVGRTYYELVSARQVL